ncbi:hypothetical protein THAOC_35164 [Thalassiosira oceanica]|uniref:Uncharacterized protein n=1 Tax=Thalassiosira oceanica TaxID=159749 RepID=K0R1C0_THAOC|nr:hypothetical protein THAOC_35164 [Thalassiosira oceanica]|eukprot:EJK46178.1 hypothetical protein THAOC_35164 [Thalassiosira oceanica]
MVKFFRILSFLATTAVKGQEQLLSNNEADIPTEDADAVDEQSTPICADGEELFRLQLTTSELVGLSFASYRIFTNSPSPASDTEIHAECVGCTNYFPGADVQLCLPKDQCHTTAVGRKIGRLNSCGQRAVDEVEELVMTWGGEIIHESNNYLFASVDFGDGCQDYTRCDDGEAEFEFFLDRHILGAVGPYSIRRDGAIIAESDLRMGFDSFSGYKLNQTVNLGESCTASTACDPRAESLVELDITVNAEHKCPDSEIYSSTVPAEELLFKLADEGDTFSVKMFWSHKDYYVWSGSYANDFEIDTLYTYIGCIPKDRRVKLSVGSDRFAASYKVYQDGVEMTERVIHREGRYEGLTTTDFLGYVDVYSSGSALSLFRGGVLAAAILLTKVLGTS